MRTAIGSWVCLLGVFAACGGDDDEASNRGRGSDACRDFQDAACDFAVDRCGVTGRALCDQSFQSLACTSDEMASACANALNEATCGVAVTGCNLQALIDPAPAIAGCETLADTLCTRLVECGQFATAQECQAENTAAGLDCTQALGIGLGFEDCLPMIEELTCGSQLPPGCSAVIVVQPPQI